MEPPITAEFAQRYEAERTAWTRRRFLWLCVVVGTVMLLSAASNIATLIESSPGGGSLSSEQVGSLGETRLDLVGDGLMILLYAAGFVYVYRFARTRARIVVLTSLLIFLASMVQTFVAPISNYLDYTGGAPGWTPQQVQLFLGGIALLAIFVLHFSGSLFVAMTAKEALWAFIPTAAGYCVMMGAFLDAPWRLKVYLIAGSLLAGAPGIVWTWWRHARFTEKFHDRMIRGRYGEIKHELADARRFHEALFPPPITRGALRLTYAYEPMREIGGDFLFARPLSFPPSVPEQPLSVVVIDVTGHGVAAALAVNRLHGELERTFAGHPGSSPAEVIRALNRYANLELAPLGMFATALCLRVDAAREIVEWSNAGHPPAVIRTASGQVRLAEPTAVMLGVLEDEAFDSAQQAAPFGPGDVVIAYTDGVIEAQGLAAEQFGVERLMALVTDAALNQNGGGLARAVFEAVEKHRQDQPSDDVLVVEVRSGADPSDSSPEGSRAEPGSPGVT